jgi:uncharacterized protein YycO
MKMTKSRQRRLRTMTAAFALLALLNGAQAYDFANNMTCNVEEIQFQVQDLWSSAGVTMRDNAKVLLVKNVKELARDKDKLVCSAYIKANLGNYEGTWVLMYYNQDGKTFVRTRQFDSTRNY